jgi:hypothetical protein
MAYTILGGRLGGPVDLSIEGQLPVPLETVCQNIEAAAARDLPGIPRLSRLGRKLVVIGGGPSISDYQDELCTLAVDPMTDVWAVNGAWIWCQDRGIDATFFAVDPHPIVLNWLQAKDGSLPKRTILSVCCDPKVFDRLSGSEIIALAQGKEDLKGGSSTAGLAPHLAMLMGYSGVIFYGCESSYQMGMSHAYMHEARDEEMIIVADGCEHLTAPDFMMQAKELAAFINAFPEYLTERSGGLLRALINDLKAERPMSIKWISQGMVDGLKNFRPAGLTEANLKAAE